jgi:hypothetical protein
MGSITGLSSDVHGDDGLRACRDERLIVVASMFNVSGRQSASTGAGAGTTASPVAATCT